MKTLTVEHTTTYRYDQPVALGAHRLMIRPRDSHDIRLLDTGLSVRPAPERLTWMHDVFGNSIAVARFGGDRTTRLAIKSRIVLVRYPPATEVFPVTDYAASYPFRYDDDDLPDLMHLIQRHYPDPDAAVERWARRFLATGPSTPTRELLLTMTSTIKAQFAYRAREAEGTQSPAETLAKGTGSCRDFALLMMESLRALGLATRFVSGYLYDPAVDDESAATGSDGTERTDGTHDQGANETAGAGGTTGVASKTDASKSGASKTDASKSGALAGAEATVGGGATHAWMEVYLPGAGWLEFDPTNGCESGGNLVRVAATRDPGQAVPVGGTWSGPANAFAGLDVEVRVSANAHGV